MNIQIFGISKCFDTKKAERYFKERRIKYQLIDLNLKGLSKGELRAVIGAVGLNELIDKNSKEYERLNMGHIFTHNVREEILFNNPKLCKTPIVRDGKKATVGYVPEVWSTWE